jgi:predicted kinase
MSRFLVVTGLPASGKSTVGAAVAAALGLPFFDKDVILEALFQGLGTGDASWRTRLSRAADEVLRRLALSTDGAVLASWWRHPRSRSLSGTSPEWLSSLPGEIVELHCRCRPETAAERFFARRRHAGHLDDTKSPAQVLAEFEELREHGPLGFGRVVEIDTEQRVDLNVVLRLIQDHS